MPKKSVPSRRAVLADAKRVLAEAHRMLETTGGTKAGRKWAQLAQSARHVLNAHNQRLH